MRILPFKKPKKGFMIAGVDYNDDSGGGSSYTLPSATADTLGGVKIGSGVDVTSDGTISVDSYTLPSATTNRLGGVKIGSGVTVGEDGTISVNSSGNDPFELRVFNSSVPFPLYKWNNKGMKYITIATNFQGETSHTYNLPENVDFIAILFCTCFPQGSVSDASSIRLKTSDVTITMPARNKIKVEAPDYTQCYVGLIYTTN